MLLTWEDKEALTAITEAQLRRKLARKRGGDTSFVILERDDGAYVQMIGGGVACCLEWRDTKAHRHYRGFLDPPRVPWREPALLGQVRLSPGEFLFIEDVVEAFCAFLTDRSFPTQIHWRDVTDELQAAGVRKP